MRCRLGGAAPVSLIIDLPAVLLGLAPADGLAHPVRASLLPGGGNRLAPLAEARVERGPDHRWHLALAGTLGDGSPLQAELSCRVTALSCRLPAGPAWAEEAVRTLDLLAARLGVDLAAGSCLDLDLDTVCERTWMSDAVLKPHLAPAPAPAPARATVAPSPSAVVMPTPALPLVAGGRGCAVTAATLSLIADGDGPWIAADLVIGTPEGGEDGAVRPTLEASLPRPLRFAPTGAWTVLAPGAVEGWLGNDAPELTVTDWRLRLLPQGGVELALRASYDDGPTPQELVYQGPLDLTLAIQADSREALPAALARVWGDDPRLHLGAITALRRPAGPDAPARDKVEAAVHIDPDPGSPPG